MAKKSSGPNKSQAIRDYYAANPKAKPMEVSEALKAQGVDVTPAFVSTIRSTSKKKKVGKPGRPSKSASAAPTASKRGPKPGRPAKAGKAAKTAAPAAAGSSNVSIEALIKAKQMVSEVGSISEARAALAALERLMK